VTTAFQTLPLPGGLQTNRRLGQWLRVRPDGVVEMFSGKVEIGQGILTALAQIVADGLGVPFDRIRPVAASTAHSPNEAITSGSLSVQDSGSALRQVCAEVRSIYLQAAAARLGSPADQLVIDRGDIVGPNGDRTSYWDLADDALLDRDATGLPVAVAAPNAATQRIDLPDKVFGRPRYIHDLDLPGLVHGRILRPVASHARLRSVDQARVLACEGVIAVVRDGSLLGVLAETERQAEQALAALGDAAAWDMADGALPDQDALPAWLRTQPIESKVVAYKHDPSLGANQPQVSRTLRTSFAKPFLAHASIAPSCALARFDGATLEVWTHSQGIYNLRTDLALAFGLHADAIIVQHVEGAGCYGHNPADDAAFDAAWLARAAGGCPVRVQWTRSDELAWAPFSPAMAVDLEADLDASGAIVGWRHTVWSNGHSTRPGRATSPALLGSWHMDPPFERQPAINAPLAAGGGAERNAVPSYDFPAWQVVNNRVLSMPLRSSAMRALGAFANVFAVEQLMDELAYANGSDPVAYRLRHLADTRARAVIALAVARSGWAGEKLADHGRGLGFARYKNTGAYCAVVAEIEAAAEIRVKRLTIAVDVGLAVNADGVANQIEGGAIQATSWILKEVVRFDRNRITSDTWDTYPILRFSDVPAVDVHIVPSTQPSVGAGEGSVGPTAGAIANAVFDALGVRVRQMPLSAEHVIAAFDQGNG
jgi:nicotinate dehydrogenase subunit B